MKEGGNMQDKELMHYGVLGMKWGVRRARKATSSGNYDKAKTIINRHTSKIAKKSRKLDRQYQSLSKQRAKQITTSDIKATKYAKKAAKLRNKAYGRFTSKAKAEKSLFKAEKLETKANRLKTISQETQAKINKNRYINEQMTKGLSELKALSEKGKKYVN